MASTSSSDSKALVLRSTDNKVALRSSDDKTVVLRSSDGQEFGVSTEMIAASCGMIKNMLDDDCTDGGIPLPVVTGAILSRVIEYCDRHFDNGGRESPASSHFGHDDEALERFDADFMEVDQDTLFDLLQAANYLSIPGLVDLACKTVGEQMRGKTVDQMRKHFHVECDYTEEELAEVMKENPWAFE